MTIVADLLIGWGSLNAFVVFLLAALARRRGELMRRAPKNIVVAVDRMPWVPRHESK
jgi:hypothetical protein